MEKAYIKDVCYYLPSQILRNSVIAEKFPEWSAEKIAKKLGISERHIVAENETATDLAYRVAESLFLNKPEYRSQIDFIIFCTQSPDYKLPTSACILQNRLNLGTNCGAFDFNLGCSGYVYGLAIAKGLITAKIAKNVLFLTAETYSKYIHQSDKGNMTLFGDAATATLISNEGFAEISDFVLGTDGSGEDFLKVKEGGARYPNFKNIKQNTETNDADRFLWMDGPGIFNFTAEAVPKLVEALLKKEGIQKEDINLWVFHQANKYMINYLRKLLDIDKDKFFIFMEKVGNTVSNTIPIALYEARKEQKLKGKVLIAGFGVGLSWGATILTCK